MNLTASTSFRRPATAVVFTFTLPGFVPFFLRATEIGMISVHVAGVPNGGSKMTALPPRRDAAILPTPRSTVSEIAPRATSFETPESPQPASLKHQATRSVQRPG